MAEPADESRDGLDLARVRLIETRLLVRREGLGRDALRVERGADRGHAGACGRHLPLELRATDGSRDAAVRLQVPDENQCAGCHATDNSTRAICIRSGRRRATSIAMTLGTRARTSWRTWRARLPDGAAGRPACRAMRDFDDADAQARRPRPCLPRRQLRPLPQRRTARPITSGLWLDAATSDDPIRLGLCKPPVAAGQGTGDHMFDIVPGKPEESILVLPHGQPRSRRDDARARARDRASKKAWHWSATGSAHGWATAAIR